MDLHVLLGNLSFGLTAASWMLRSLLWLRLTSIIATAIGIWFNYIIPGGPLWQVIYWLSFFQLINLIQIALLLRGMSESALTNREKFILVAAWPQMHSRDFRAMMKQGESTSLEPNEKVLRVGDSTDALWLVVDGWLEEDRDDGRKYRLGVGSTIGGATFIARDNLGGSPSSIAAGERGVAIVRWPYETLYDLIERHPRMGSPLYEGITRAMIVKYRMLREHEAAPLTAYRPVDRALLP
jgi:CRP-like cAMP-binding protein